MEEITIYNNGSSQMSVMALGKAINWNPKTTLIVSEKEAELLLKYEHIVKLEDLKTNDLTGSLKVENEALKKEVLELKEKLAKLTSNEIVLDREALKEKAKSLGIDFHSTIGTAKLADLIKSKK